MRVRKRRAYRPRRIVERLRSNLFVLPIASAAIAASLAKLLARVDRSIPQDRATWYLFVGDDEAARNLLTTIATVLMTLTGLVFSITLLVLQLASSQFSPRVVQTFLADRLTRIALGSFIGTFTYAMVLLPEVRGGSSEEDGFVPSLAVFVGLFGALVSIAIFVRYIHAIAHAVRAVDLISRIAKDAREGIERVHPRRAADPDGDRPCAPPEGGVVVTSSGNPGVVAWVEERALLDLAASRGIILVLSPRVGEFVPHDAPLFRVLGEAPVDRAELECLVGLEDERTPHQDPSFGVRQLVDIAVRSLSPGVNDPATAVQAIDQIHDLLRRLARRAFPDCARHDAAGEPRLYVGYASFEEYLHLSFDEIRHYGAGSLQVMRRLRSALDDLHALAPPHRRPAVDAHRALLDEAVEHGFALESERDLARRPMGVMRD